MAADLILRRGRIYTMDPALPCAESVAIAGNRILSVGTDTEIDALYVPGTRVVDLTGRAVIPGLIDAHVHFGWWVQRRQRIDLSNATSVEECLERVAARVATTRRGEWLRGDSWDRNLWSDSSFSNRFALDEVAPEHPVALSSKDGHCLWVNTRALVILGIGPDTPDPAGGEITRDPQSGMPTGILKETAQNLVTDHLPKPDLLAYETLLRQGIIEVHRLGITSVHDPEDKEEFAAYQSLRNKAELLLRVYMMLPVRSLNQIIEVGLRTGFGDETLRVGPVKIFADGALGSRTADMLEPYDNDPPNYGIETTASEELRQLARRCNAAGLAVAIHAIGDRANRRTLDVLSEIHAEGLDVGLRNRIEHMQLLTPEDLPRLAACGTIASMQPIHATSDMEIGNRYWGRRARYSYAWRSVLDAGGRLAFGSDSPVESINPFWGIHAAVTRRRANGTPQSGWYPQECISVKEAVHAYTLGAAYASGEERVKGSITPGKLADLVVLSDDIFTVEPDRIRETVPEMTIFDGRVVFER